MKSAICEMSATFLLVLVGTATAALPAQPGLNPGTLLAKCADYSTAGYSCQWGVCHTRHVGAMREK